MNNPNDRQIAGVHYRTDFQHWDFAAAVYGPGYFKGQVTKYVTRWRHKNGTQDLEKAKHFLEKMISINWDGLNWPLHRVCPIDIESYSRLNKLTPAEESIIFMVTIAADEGTLRRALAKLDALMAEVQGDATPAYVKQD